MLVKLKNNQMYIKIIKKKKREVDGLIVDLIIDLWHEGIKIWDEEYDFDFSKFRRSNEDLFLFNVN